MREDFICIKQYRNNDGLNKNDKITILQTEDVNTLLNKNSEMILFIEKYRGSVIQDAYVIIGHDYGQYVISQKSLKKVTKNILMNTGAEAPVFLMVRPAWAATWR